MARVLIACSDVDFDPTEVVAPWRVLAGAGHEVRFATVTGAVGRCDPRVLAGPFFGTLGARPEAVRAYAELEADPAFLAPARYDDVDPATVDLLVLPGGHAQGMRPYLESEALQRLVVACFRRQIPVGAICHGPVVLARSVDPATGRPVIDGRHLTALTELLELTAWALTSWTLGDYYRTYDTTVQAEVRAAAGEAGRFDAGPLAATYGRPFVVRDGNLITARWPGDAWGWAASLAVAAAGLAPAATPIAVSRPEE